MWLAWTLACSGPQTGDTDSDSPADSDVSETDVDLNSDLDTATPEHATTVLGLDGGATWAVDFDADAEAAGYVDCSYHRAYAGAVEVSDVPWLCPTCEVIVRTAVTMDQGLEDCYHVITNGGTPSPVEYLGWSGTSWMRASTENFLLTAQGVAVPGTDAITWSHETPYNFEDADGNAWGATFHITGEATLSDAVADPMRGLWPPDAYECGWPKADPPPWDGDFTLAIGETLPDGVFRDVCNDGVRLHDLLGEWLVIDISAMDCGPCQQMAEDTPAAIEALALEGLDARAVTLLAPSLADTLPTATRQQLYDWTLAFDLHDPVLGDRGYGTWVIGASASDAFGEGFAYPTWVVVSPEGTVVGGHVGYGSWEDVAAVIRANR
jgi:hypothetical protein